MPSLGIHGTQYSTKCCPICAERLTPAIIDITFPHWREKLSRIENQEKFFEFDSGLFLSVDFVKGEKIPYYDGSYQVYYKQTLRERKAEVRFHDLPSVCCQQYPTLC